MEKRQRRILFSPDFSATLSLVIRELVTPATVSRPERSDRVARRRHFIATSILHLRHAATFSLAI